MKKLLTGALLAAIATACAPSNDTNINRAGVRDDFHPGSVSPRAEERFSLNYQGSSSYSGSNSVQKFDPSDIRTRNEINKAIRPDSIDKEFAVDGQQVNAELF